MPAIATCLAASVLLAWVVGCRAPARSTRLTGGDLDQVVLAMRDSLAGSAFLAGRHAGSPRAVIVLNRVENLSSDVITTAEQWMMVARVRSALPIREMAKRRHIVFQITPERYALLREAGFEGPLENPMPPTHVMAATIRSARRSGRVEADVTDRRAEYYHLEYRITEVRSREVVWSDSFDLKREAVGRVID